MDYPMFLESACSLRPYFEKCALIGQKFCQEPPKTVFLRLREAGIKAETNMLKVTNGVNTHKGAIFSLGLIVGAAGRLRGLHKLLSATSIGLVAASLVEGIVRDELTTLRDKIPNKSLSIGEKLFLKYGVGGIRREAEAGFPTAVMACQCLKNLLNYGVPLEIALPQVLLIIIKQSFDTNLLWRGGLKGVHYAKQSVADALNKGGWLAPAGQVIVGHMVGEFARQNLSPGGSADLLAVAIFFLLVDQSPNGLLDLPMLISQVRSRTIEFDPLIERSYLG
jgi:triphosphoribosyl-dephospho-CoA synthetase